MQEIRKIQRDAIFLGFIQDAVILRKVWRILCGGQSQRF